MRIFNCDHCGHVVAFSAHSCSGCGAELGFLDDMGAVRVLTPTNVPASYGVHGRDDLVWRCLNAPWGCNWVVAAGATNPWCRSCQLTRGRPDVNRPPSIDAWTKAEAAKRQLVHQLDELGLPIDIRSSSTPDGLAFDLVHVPGTGGVTGHADGIVTLDLAEADDHHREDLRRRLDEPFRTLIGHLRHEIGHHYWRRLVGQSDDLARFRTLFGDERVDYASSIEQHYTTLREPLDHSVFLTSYAASHPFEDWAETFAHYLHIVDALDTAVAHRLGNAELNRLENARAIGTLPFDDILAAWRPINGGLTAIAQSLGLPALYPFEPDGAVADKLAFVHDQIAAHTVPTPVDVLR